jgi:hypothetical protein
MFQRNLRLSIYLQGRSVSQAVIKNWRTAMFLPSMRFSLPFLYFSPSSYLYFYYAFSEADLDLRNPTLGYGFHIQRRNPGTFPVESPTSDHGRPMVCAEYYYPTRSPHANGQGRNVHPTALTTATASVHTLQLSLQPLPQCTPYSSHYSHRLSAHPNDLILPLLEPADLRRLRRFLPNDLPTRF